MSDTSDNKLNHELDEYGVWVKASQNDSQDSQNSDDKLDIPDLDMILEPENENSENKIDETDNNSDKNLLQTGYFEDIKPEDDLSIDETLENFETLDIPELDETFDFETLENTETQETQSAPEDFETSESSQEKSLAKNENSEATENFEIPEITEDFDINQDEKEISLDEFIDGSFTEPNQEENPQDENKNENSLQGTENSSENFEISNPIDDFEKENNENFTNDENFDVPVFSEVDSVSSEELDAQNSNQNAEDSFVKTDSSNKDLPAAEDFSDLVDFDDIADFAAESNSDSASSSDDSFAKDLLAGAEDESEKDETENLNVEETDFTEAKDSNQDENQNTNQSETEISLDDFMDGGFTEQNPSETTSVPAENSGEQEISLSDFGMDNEISVDEFMGSDFSAQKEDETVQFNEEPMDINLDFEDVSYEQVDDSNQKDDDITENIFDKTPTKPYEEAIDLDNFDSFFDNIPDESATNKDETSTKSEDFKINDIESKSENIDISEFGFEDDENPQISDEKINAKNENTDFDIEVSADETQIENTPITEEAENDSDDVSIEITGDEKTEENPQQIFDEANSVDDFDIDSILNNVEDESGKTESLIDKAEDSSDAEDSLLTDSTGVQAEDAHLTDSADMQAEDAHLTNSANSEPETSASFAVEPEELEEAHESENHQGADFLQDILSQNISSENSQDETLSGVSLTLDDLEKLKDAPVVKPSEKDFYHAGDSNDLGFDHVDEPDFEETQKPVYQEDEEIINPNDYTQFEFDNADTNDTNKEEKMAMENSQATNILKEQNVPDENKILMQISSELANLRNEISNLKNEFEDLKKNSLKDDDEISLPQKDTSESQGFFSDTDEDDTIALSGDELNNILNNAEFTSEESSINPENSEQIQDEQNQSADNLQSEISDTDNEDNKNPDEEKPSIDFENEHLEEPVFDEDKIDLTNTEFDNSQDEDSNLPEEISVPKVDDILVESADDNFMDEPEAEPQIQETKKSEDLEEDSVLDEKDVPDTTLESLSKPIDIFNENDDESKAEDETKTEDEFKDEDETLEEGISENPVENVFTDNWQNSASNSENLPETEQTEDDSQNLQAANENQNAINNSSEIPSDMKQEIKSVLTYMDQLLESLPEDKIQEFAKSEQFETYKKLFNELGLA